LTLNEETPLLFPDYQKMMQTYMESKSHKRCCSVYQTKLEWFIDAIRQRQETLFVTMNAIMYQGDYLDGEKTNVQSQKKDTDLVGLISTMFLVANSKYVETPYGTKLIKEFFQR
jgi:RNA polymerase sigma-54 factor